HIIFRMHLEEALVLPLVDDDLEMLVLEARPSQCGRGKRRKAATRLRRQIPNAGHCVHGPRLRFPDYGEWLRLRRHAAVLAAWNHDAGASAALNELPGVPLKVDGRSALARRAGTGGAVILPLEGDAVAFLLTRGDCSVPLGLRQRRCKGGRSYGCSDGAGQDRGGGFLFCGHMSVSRLGYVLHPEAHSCYFGFEIPSVTAYETKEEFDFASWRSAAASESRPRVKRARGSPFSPRHQRVRRGSVMRVNSVTAPQLSEYHTATKNGSSKGHSNTKTKAPQAAAARPAAKAVPLRSVGAPRRISKPRPITAGMDSATIV